jgi:penicillin-binding protein 1C
MKSRSPRGLNAFPNVATIRRKKVKKSQTQRITPAKILALVATLAVVGTVIGAIGAVSAVAYVSRDLPSPTKLTDRQIAQSTKIYDRNGELLYDIFDGTHDRTLLKLKDIPQSVKDATIAAEDANFYSHRGFDIKGIAYALYRDVVSRGIAGGGSTITQQLVKNAVLNDTAQTPTRKLKELILAVQIERKYSKDDILQIYLNEIPYGGTAYGIEAASHHYLGKSAKDLDLAEAALLAGLPQSPSRYNPFLNPEGAYSRQHYVIRRLVETKKITKEQADAAEAKKIAFTSGAGLSNVKAPHFSLFVKELLEEQYGTRLVEQGGLRVTTTLDLKKQQIAEEEVRKQLENMAKSKANAHNAGLIAVDPKSGHVLAYIGSQDFSDADHGGNIDIIQRPRQPGSAIKPIEYLAGFTKGFTLGTYLGDIKTCFGGTPEYCPGNSDDKFWGPILPREALANSRNIPAVKMTQLVGVNGVIDMAHKLGVTTLNDRKSYGLSLGLGAAEIPPYDIAQVYATFANSGTQQTLTSILKVEDSNGHVLDQYSPSAGKKIVDPRYTYLISNVLSDNDVRKRLFGATNKLEIGRPAAVKTGTTNDNKDAWTAGYTPSLTTVVWVGNFDNAPMNGIQGSTGATPIWNGVMKRFLEGTPPEPFKQPEGMVTVTVDALSGMLPGPYTTKTRSELFVKGTEPQQQDTFGKQVQIDRVSGLLASAGQVAKGGADNRVCVQLQEQMKEWQGYTDAWMKAAGQPYGCPTETAKDTSIASNGGLSVQITSPTNGQNMTSGKMTVAAQIGGQPSEVFFLLDGVALKKVTAAPYQAELNLDKGMTGSHTITVRANDASGNEVSGSVQITVGGAGGVEVATPSPVLGLQRARFPHR